MKYSINLSPYPLLPVPHSRNLSMTHLLLQLENTIHQSFRSRRTPGHIDINRHNPITTSCNTITIVIIPATVRTTSHRNNPSRIRHLIVDLSQSRSHLVRKSTSNDHDIGLTRRSTEDYTEAILIVSWGGEMHHFNGAAGKSEGHGPEGALTCPVCYLIKRRQSILHDTFLSLLTRQWHLSSYLSGNTLHRWWRRWVPWHTVW